MLHCAVEFCAAVLNIVMCSCLLCSFFHMLHCVVEFFAAVFHVVMSSCMLCSVVTYYQVLLQAVQCC